MTTHKIDTYVITATFADYDQPATATDYVSVVGKAYATARREAAYLALNYLRSTPAMCKGQTNVNAKYVNVEVWAEDSYSPLATVEILPTYEGDFRGVRDIIARATEEESKYTTILR